MVLWDSIIMTWALSLSQVLKFVSSHMVPFSNKGRILNLDLFPLRSPGPILIIK